MKALELRGYKSMRALNAYSTLVLGLKMLPAYIGESYEDFLDRAEKMGPEDQRKLFRQAAEFVELQKEELEAVLSFVADPNGVAYTEANIKSLRPTELVEAIVLVCMEIAKIKVDLVTEEEKKNYRGSR